MSELRKLQTTDWERRSLAETADATAHIYPDTARVIQELLSDYDVLRAETATLAAENDELGEGLRRMQTDNDVLRAQVARLREAGRRLSDEVVAQCFGEYLAVNVDAALRQMDAALAATAPTGEEPTR